MPGGTLPHGVFMPKAECDICGVGFSLRATDHCIRDHTCVAKNKEAALATAAPGPPQQAVPPAPPPAKHTLPESLPPRKRHKLDAATKAGAEALLEMAA